MSLTLAMSTVLSTEISNMAGVMIHPVTTER